MIADMAERCEEQGHDWVNCCSIFLEVYQRCKWCRQTRTIEEIRASAARYQEKQS